jgi:hypothetical protein
MRLRINIAISLVALIAICWGVRFAVVQERRRTQEFLQAKYQELNRTYFHNQLPSAQIDWADLTEENRVGKTYLKEGNRYLVRCGWVVQVPILPSAQIYIGLKPLKLSN